MKMKRKFMILVVMSALAALALPASSMAWFSTPNGEFIVEGNGPKFSTSETGSCQVQKVPLAKLSAEPWKQPIVPLAVAPTAVCTGGMSMTMTGEWSISGIKSGGETARVFPSNNASTSTAIRYSSIPGCVLKGSAAFEGVWTYGGLQYSRFNPSKMLGGATSSSFVWENDGSSSCGLKGFHFNVTIQPGAATMTVATFKHGVSEIYGVQVF
jgi:hypothetical protein